MLRRYTEIKKPDLNADGGTGEQEGNIDIEVIKSLGDEICHVGVVLYKDHKDRAKYVYKFFDPIDKVVVYGIFTIELEYNYVHKNHIYDEKRYKLHAINVFLDWWRSLWMLLSYQLGYRIYGVPNFSDVVESKKSEMQTLLNTINSNDDLASLTSWRLADMICIAANNGNEKAQEFVVEHFESVIASPKLAREATAPLRERVKNPGEGHQQQSNRNLL